MKPVYEGSGMSTNLSEVDKPLRPLRGTATISDVARLAGVSGMTVSRVINASPKVRRSTRDRVNAAIEQLNYTPNAAARSLARNEHVRLGLLYAIPSTAYLAEFLESGLDQATRAHANLIVKRCQPHANHMEAARQLIAEGVDGLLLSLPLCDLPELLELLEEANCIAVAVAAGKPAASMSAVSIDDGRAAFEMTRHLIRLGHRRIGFILGDSRHGSTKRRLEGYRRALEEGGLPHDTSLEAAGLFTYRSGLDAAEALLQLEEAPTAIFASNDDMAAAAVAVAHSHGLHVPADLTVCGFDDTIFASMIWPELTTIRQPIGEMARLGVDLLVKELRDHRAGKPVEHSHILLDFLLIRRQSDAPPRVRPKATGVRASV